MTMTEPVRSSEELLVERDRSLAGAGLVLVSCLGGGAVVVLARLAYEGGSNAPTSLLVRFALAGGLLWFWLAVRGQAVRLPARVVWRFVHLFQERFFERGWLFQEDIDAQFARQTFRNFRINGGIDVRHHSHSHHDFEDLRNRHTRGEFGS